MSARKPAARSRITALIPVDGRTSAARRFAEIRSAIFADLGGEDQISEARRQLIERFVTLCSWSEAQDSLALSGQEIDSEVYGRIAGHMKRLADAIGVERVPRDVTDLHQYIEAKANEAESA